MISKKQLLPDSPTMPKIKRLVLDVLKPHHPNVLDFALAIAGTGEDFQVKLKVIEMDDKTETLEVIIEGSDIVLEPIVTAINELGGSLHSIDGVCVENEKIE
jgi:hypothetical protein